MVPLKETPQLFRKSLTLQMAVDDRKLYVASKQSSRDPPSASAILLLCCPHCLLLTRFFTAFSILWVGYS